MKKEFDVKGMHCKSCEMLVKDGVGDVKGVKSVTASSAHGKVVVDFDEQNTNQKEIVEAIKKEGYKVIGEK